jgi:hypothetical protein
LSHFPSEYEPEAAPFTSGGFASVFFAQGPEGRVVLKVPRAVDDAGLAAHDAFDAIQREIQLLRQIAATSDGQERHAPRLVEALTLGLHDGLRAPAFLMNEVQGVPLDRLFTTQRMDPRRLVRIAEQVCEVLEALYRLPGGPYAHLDLKPENVLVARERGHAGEPIDVVTVIDYGSASGPGAPPTFVGITPQFAAPEQLARRFAGVAAELGAPGAYEPVDGRADLWAVGVFLHLGLSGKLPHPLSHQPTDDELRRVMRSDAATPPLPSAATLPDGLSEIVRRCLIKRPEERFQTPAELLAALRAIAWELHVPRDWPTVNAAVAAARDGQRVVLAAGEYLLPSPLVLSRPVTITGAGPARTVLRSHAQPATVQAGTGRLEALRIVNEGGGAALVISNDAVVHDCEVRGHDLGGVQIVHAGAPLLTGLVARGSRGPGVLVTDSACPRLEEVEVLDNGGDGVVVQGNAGPRLYACRVHGNHGHGVRVIGAARGTYDSCELWNNGGDGLRVQDKASPAVIRCGCADNRGAGLSLGGRARGQYDDCELTGNDGDGVRVEESAAPLLRRCESTGNRGAGLRIGERARGIYENCVALDNGGDGIVVEGEARPSFRPTPPAARDRR